jgi:hypothetical protein
MPAGAARRSFAIDFRLHGQTGGSGDSLNSLTEIQLEPVSKSICCARCSTSPGRLDSPGGYLGNLNLQMAFARKSAHPANQSAKDVSNN